MSEHFRGELLTMGRYTNLAFFMNCIQIVGEILYTSDCWRDLVYLRLLERSCIPQIVGEILYTSDCWRDLASLLDHFKHYACFIMCVTLTLAASCYLSSVVSVGVTPTLAACVVCCVDRYVYYCMKYINNLLSFGIKPIMVFDGCRLPSKQDVEKSRRE